MTLRLGSLCTGYAGLDLAVAQVLDVEPAWHAEVDPAASKVLAHHWPAVPNLGDVTAVDWATVEPVDVLTAGFPCQDISQAGKGAGLEGARSGLWWEIVTAIAVLRPQYVVLENVSALLTGYDEVFDAPVSCLCGRPIGRGGLHHDQRPPGQGHERGDLGGSRHDETSTPDPAPARVPVRGARPAATRGDGPLGGGLAVDDSRRAGGGDARTGRTDVAAQSGAGASGAAVPAVAVFAAYGAAAEAAGRVDSGGAGGWSDLHPADPGAESEGAGCPGEPWPADCPSCGRAVGDGPSEPVRRFWMGAVLGSLAQVGYDARWCCVRASDVGACHRRERVFIVATDAGSAGTRRDGRAVPRTAPQGRRPGGDVHAALNARPDVVADASGTVGRSVGDAERGDRSPTSRGRGQTEPRGRHSAPADPERRRPQAREGVADCSPQWELPAGDDADRLGRTSWGVYEPAIRRHERALGRPAPEPTDERGRLSPRFVEWMMMLPDGWVATVRNGRTGQLRMLGNGVVPAQGAAALLSLIPQNLETREAV